MNVMTRQGIPVNAVIKVRNSESFLIRVYRRTASVVDLSREIGRNVDLTF
jgi:hypothetical protein